MFPIVNKLKYWLGAGAITLMAAPVTVVPGETIALWNFNETSGAIVADQVTSGQRDGTASTSVQIVSGASLGTGFGSARNFSTGGSFIDLGTVAGTKLDLVNTSQASVEAVIYMTADITTPATIFDNHELQLQVIGNKLAGFVRQSSGFKGIISPVTLSKNTAYRVGLHLKNGYLTISLDNKVLTGVKISESIQAAESGATATIGGNPSGMNFLGIIDDVRLSNTATLDTVPPTITVISPDTSVPTVDGNPSFTIALADNEDQIDETTISVKVNGQTDTGLTYNPTTHELSGSLSQPLTAGQKNNVVVSVKDMAGNFSQSTIEIKYINWGSGEEYVSDSNTLGLWHLNEREAGWVKDSSSYGRHGKPKGTTPAPGIFGSGRSFGFDMVGSSPIWDQLILPPVPVIGRVFTLEMWIKPMNEYTSSTEVFNNDQIRVQRTNAGAVNLIFKMSNGQEVTYSSLVNALPVGKFTHLKIVYDGNLRSKNLLVLADGILVNAIDADPMFDFNEDPKITTIGGTGFVGIIDEVRMSKNIRESVNVIRGLAPNIEVGIPVDYSTTRAANLNIYAKLLDASGITPANVQVVLNGVVQTGGGITVSATEVKGVLPDLLQKGVNELEIKVTGDSNNQSLIQKKIFYIPDNGKAEYAVDNHTMALWHFNESAGATTFNDVSAKNNSLVVPAGAATSVAGVFANGITFTAATLQTTKDLDIFGSNFTIEGWLKINPSYLSSNRDMWNITGPYVNLSLRRQSKNLNLAMTINGNSTIDVVIPEVLNATDYQHIALSVDGDSTSSNLLVLVNGNVVFQKNYKNYCRSCLTTTKLTFQGYGTDIFDEIRISDVARKEFNVGTGNGPVIGFLTTVPNSTVHTSQPNFNILFTDDASIDQNSMSIAVNGVVDNTLTKSVSGTTGKLSGPITENLVNGTNEITVRAKNQNGTESVQTFYVYYITLDAATAYSVDSNTKGLWHFNSGSSTDILKDVSGRNFNISGLSSPVVTTGVFNEALNLFSTGGYPSASATAISPATKTWTIEAWTKLNNSTTFNQYMDGRSVWQINYLGGINWYPETNTPVTLPSYTFPKDGSFHHIAVIYDENNLHRQALLVLDGTVIDARRVSNTNLNNMTFSSMSSGYWYDTQIDEMRLSDKARYTMTYSKTSSFLFRNAKYLNAKRVNRTGK